MMTPALLAVILASLENTAHAWELLAFSSHTETTPPFTGTKTYQLKSEPLDLILIVMVKIEAGTFERASVYYKGSSLETEDEDLYTALSALETTKLSDIEDELETILGG